MSEPLTAAELAVIAAETRDFRECYSEGEEPHAYEFTRTTERLLADLQALRAAVTALFVGANYGDYTVAGCDAVYTDWDGPGGETRCVFCHAYLDMDDPHTSDCAWAALRALLPLDVQRADRPEHQQHGG